MLLSHEQAEVRGRSSELVVIVHAWTSSPSKLGSVRAAVAEQLPDADLLMPAYPSGVFSNADPFSIAEELVHAVDSAVQRRRALGTPYARIVLVGHSLGALLVRKAYVLARGEMQDVSAPLRSKPKDWADLVERILLLAGTNRGWKIETRPRHMGRGKWLSFRLAAKLHRWLRVGKLINGVRRGSPFVANLRVQWIRLARGVHPPPLTIQLLGTIDDIVEQDDNVDVQSGAAFVYRTVPNTGHANVVDFSGPAGALRKQIFVQCLCAKREELVSDQLPPLQPDADVQRVVFILHGIRDYSHWTRSVADQVKGLAATRGENVESVTPSYGYFPMLGFLLQPERQDNVRWFMDRYTELLAKYPKALVSFIGHSNGTYILASALTRYRTCQVDRVVFAGSVVPRNYRWDELKQESRMGALQNYVASRDEVVAVFPAVFEALSKRSDLGSAGHNGFLDNEGQRHQVLYIDGHHASALRRENHETLARFALGEDVRPSAALVADSRASWVVLASKLCALIWLALGLLILGVLFTPLLLGALDAWPLTAIDWRWASVIWFALAGLGLRFVLRI